MTSPIAPGFETSTTSDSLTAHDRIGVVTAPVEPVGLPVEPDGDVEPVGPPVGLAAGAPGDVEPVTPVAVFPPLAPVPVWAGTRGRTTLNRSVKARTVTSPAVLTKSRLSDPAEAGGDTGQPSTLQMFGAAAGRELGSAALELDFADHARPFGAVPSAWCSFVQEVFLVEGKRNPAACLDASGARVLGEPAVACETPATVAAATATTATAAVSLFSPRSR
jgi:hypothetical protein